MNASWFQFVPSCVTVLVQLLVVVVVVVVVVVLVVFLVLFVCAVLVMEIDRVRVPAC